MVFATGSAAVKAGDTSRDNVCPLTVQAGKEFGSKFGTFRHDDMIDKPYGSKIWSAKNQGFTYLLRPTPELWTVALPHRTQILYLPDIAFISQQLDVRPGRQIVEAGTGSGSFTHALSRAVGSEGIVHSYEFHPDRYGQAKAEFELHGLTNVKIRHRDVCKNGFDLTDAVDAVFLDVPAPWTAIDHAKTALRKDGLARICCFSPCIEQVQKTVDALHAAGFAEVTMYETLIRNYDVQTVELPSIGEHQRRLKDVETKKADRRLAQIRAAREEKERKLAEAAKMAAPEVDGGETLKRKLDDVEEPAAKRARTDVGEVGAAPVVDQNGLKRKLDEVDEPDSVKRARTDTEGAITPSVAEDHGLKRKADDSAEPEAVKRARTEAADVPATSDEPGTADALSAAATPQTDATDVVKALDGIDAKPNGVEEPVADTRTEPTKVLTARQLNQTRGHTSFLTFATLLPGRLTKAEMDALCDGAMDVTQSTI